MVLEFVWPRLEWGELKANLKGPKTCIGIRERSGRVLDLRPRGRGFEPQWRHCTVVLEQDTFILA